MIALGSRTKWTTCAESDKYTKQLIEDGNFTFISSWSTIQGRTPDLRRLIVLMTLTLEASQLLSRLLTTSLPSIFGRSARRLGLQRNSPRTVSFDTLLFVFMEGIFLWGRNWSVQTYHYQMESLLTQMAQRSRHSVGLWTMSLLEARSQFFHRQEGESLLDIYSPLCRQR